MAKSISVAEVREFFKSNEKQLTEEEYGNVSKAIKKLSLKIGNEKDKKGESEELKNKGNKAFQEGNLEEALSLYTQAIEADSSNYLAYSNRSLIYHKLNQNEKSAEDCFKGLEIEPSFVKFYVRLAMLYKETDQEKAREYCKKGLEIEPSNSNLKELEKALKDADLTEGNNKFDPNEIDFSKIGDLLKNENIKGMVDSLVKNKSPEELKQMMDDMLGQFRK